MVLVSYHESMNQEVSCDSGKYTEWCVHKNRWMPGSKHLVLASRTVAAARTKRNSQFLGQGLNYLHRGDE